MGEQKVSLLTDQAQMHRFVRHLLNDVQALEYMLENDWFEKGITRIGSEQEFCLIDATWRPARNSEEILEEINDEHFTTELARFNLEMNLDPVELAGSCFTKVKNQIY